MAASCTLCLVGCTTEPRGSAAGRGAITTSAQAAPALEQSAIAAMIMLRISCRPFLHRYEEDACRSDGAQFHAIAFGVPGTRKKAN
jgi:hypothetical protein